jgi:ubiquinone/menaquinone biosynthesis C-methylase UbiE
VTERGRTWEPFAREPAYVRVNEKLVNRMLRLLGRRDRCRLLDVAAGTGLMTTLAHSRAQALGIELDSVLLDVDPAALTDARRRMPSDAVRGWVRASARQLPFGEAFDLVVFANSLHLFDEQAKADSLEETLRVLHRGGVLAVNSAFYDGAAEEETAPFYGRWIRRAVVEMNRTRPGRQRADRAQAANPVSASRYGELIACAGFRLVEMRERRVLLTQSAVRAISSYLEFAKGALRASEDDAEAASRALQVTVRATFNDLGMRFLPRRWLEIIAVRP